MGIQLIWDKEFATWWSLNWHQYPEAMKEQLAEAFAAGGHRHDDAPLNPVQKETIKESVIEAIKDHAWEIANSVSTKISEKAKEKIRNAIKEHAWDIAYDALSDL